MSTSVRLAPQIERSLKDYCRRKGVTKTETISNAIVDYIAKDLDCSSGKPERVAEISPIYEAFAKTGLIATGLIATGAVVASPNGGVASKDRVREKIKLSLNRKSES